MKKKLVLLFLLIIFLAAGYIAWQLFGPTVQEPDGKYFYIKTGAVYQDVKQALLEKHIVHNTFFFEFIAKQLTYPRLVKAGRYRIRSGSSLFGLVRMLRSGNQAPVNLVINKLRLKEDLAQKIAANFECDSASVMAVQYMYEPDYSKHL
jgi:UPF0755 protein